MKKGLAIVLALMLSLGMTTVAFAASFTNDISIHDTAYTYKSGEMTEADTYEPGKTYYFPIVNNDYDYHDGDVNIDSVNALKNYSIKSSLYEGKSIFKSASFVVKSLEYSMDYDIEDGKAVFLAVTLDRTTRSTDIDYTFIISPKNNSAEIDSDEVSMVGVVEDDNTTSDNDSQEIDFRAGDDLTGYEGKYQINFDDGVEFVVDLTDQEALDFEYTDSTIGTSYLDIANKYPNANIDFHNFLGRGSERTFRHTGKLYIPAQKGDYIYEVIGGAPQKVTATYSSSNEYFVISTKRLGSYLVSDRKLGNINTSNTSGSASDTSSSSAPDSEEIIVPPSYTTANQNSSIVNPDTGANDMMDVAVALVVICTAAIGALSFRKQTK